MENEKEFSFLPLHPKELSDKDFEIYKEEFDFVFWDQSCTNIALSGSYGAGKSSVIGKAKSSYPAKNWITVSLASFDNPQKDNAIHGSSDIVKPDNGDNVSHDPAKLANTQSATENNIETEVLRQIVHKIDTKKDTTKPIESNSRSEREKEYRHRFVFSSMRSSSILAMFFLLRSIKRSRVGATHNNTNHLCHIVGNRGRDYLSLRFTLKAIQKTKIYGC